MQDSTPQHSEFPTIAEKVDFLRRPDSYVDQPASMEVKETHMAWVFLTARHAWKIKKPVRNDFLDFSTVQAREATCRRELELNRRLAPDVYLDVVPLIVDDRGEMCLNGVGETVDWLVKMRRLPASRMLDELIGQKRIREPEIRKAGRKLAEFYRKASPVRVETEIHRRRLFESIRSQRDALCRPEFEMPHDRIHEVSEALLTFVENNGELLNDRIRQGRIVNAHGDLRPEHVCLEDPPVIIDCLEFNRDLRIQDTASDFSFLALECRRLGATDASDWLWDTYFEHAADSPPGKLLRFYAGLHALTRGKIALWHLDDEEVKNPEKWQEKARNYLDLAEEFAPST